MNAHIRVIQDLLWPSNQLLDEIQYGTAQYPTSDGLETCDILDILKQCSNEEECNCDNGSEIDVSNSDDRVCSKINQVRFYENNSTA